MSWTDERIDLLKKRWADGHSASQIAGELGGVTRNAVIGKVHRLKLESRIKTAPVTEPVATVKAKPATAEPVRPAETAAPRLVVASQAGISRQPTARAIGATALKMEEEVDLVAERGLVTEQQQSAEIVPISRNLTLVQLSERTCKWPLGDPLSPDFRFCGNHSGDASPYCQYHARIAFQPVSERRRVR
ncbi:GcrA family cell cycle regulator [Aureimonas mangrovi]|uniref:GcrA family cell cycle regulator n=1 Tax=Aureimonas mangrovi TaxID=2758041 RepID=UPI00163DC2F0|nr:GcrA family cell cycle regulator [Aureimonas mangrovi]